MDAVTTGDGIVAGHDRMTVIIEFSNPSAGISLGEIYAGFSTSGYLDGGPAISRVGNSYYLVGSYADLRHALSQVTVLS